MTASLDTLRSQLGIFAKAIVSNFFLAQTLDYPKNARSLSLVEFIEVTVI